MRFANNIWAGALAVTVASFTAVSALAQQPQKPNIPVRKGILLSPVDPIRLSEHPATIGWSGELT
jgi:hypothetical protein